MATDAAQDQGAAPADGGPLAWVDPYPDFNFKVEIDGAIEGHFARCSELTVDVEVITHREGSSPFLHRMPGLVEYADITLGGGVTKATDLWQWMAKSAAGEVQRKHVGIVLLERDGVGQALRWTLINAWPRRWTLGPFDARSNRVLIQEITLTFERLEPGQPGGG